MLIRASLTQNFWVRDKSLSYSWHKRQHKHQHIGSISPCSTGMTQMGTDAYICSQKRNPEIWELESFEMVSNQTFHLLQWETLSLSSKVVKFINLIEKISRTKNS